MHQQLDDVIRLCSGGAVSSEERTIWELEKQSMYQQLDDKDEEINNQCQLVEQLKVPSLVLIRVCTCS